MEANNTKFQEAERLFNDAKYKESFFIFKELALEGNVDAQCYTGALFSGDFDKSLRNDKESYRFAMMCAEQNHPMGTSNAAYCLTYGIGCKKDEYLGSQYYKRAVDLGLNRANNDYGVALERGRGVNKSISEAKRYYQVAADNGNTIAQNNIISLEKKFNFDSNNSIDIKASVMGKWQRLFILAILAIGVGIVSFAIDGRTDSVIMAIMISHWLTCFCIILILLGLKFGGWLLKRVVPVLIVVVNLYVSYKVIKEGKYTDIMEFVVAMLASFVSPVVTYLVLQIKCKGVPYWNTLMNIPYDGLGFYKRKMKRYYDYGYSEEYQLKSVETAEFKRFYNSRVAIIAVFGLVAIALIFISKGHINFHLEWNYFNSWSAGVLYFIGLVLTLTRKVDIFKTWIVFKDKFGNETHRKPSDDLTDVVSDGFIMPLLQRFVLYPLVIALPVYYIVVVILSLFEPIMPILFILIFALIAILFKLRFVTMSRRLNRYYSSNLLSVVKIFTFIILLLAWFFFSTNRFTPYFGSHLAKKEHKELAVVDRINEVKSLVGTDINNIPPSIDDVYDRYDIVDNGDDKSKVVRFYKGDELVIVGNSFGKSSIEVINILSSSVPTRCRVKPGYSAFSLFKNKALMNKDYTTFYLDGYDIVVKNMSKSFERRRREHSNKGLKLQLMESDFTDESVVVSLLYGRH